jgi:hypothetical protein
LPAVGLLCTWCMLQAETRTTSDSTGLLVNT